MLSYQVLEYIIISPNLNVYASFTWEVIITQIKNYLQGLFSMVIP